MYDKRIEGVWQLVLLAAHPEIQEQVYEEMIKVTGGSRPVYTAHQVRFKSVVDAKTWGG